MAARLPVISTAVGGIPEMITDGKSGFLSQAKDSASLASHLVRLSQDAALQKSVAEAGHVRAEESFSIQSMLSGYANMYQEMINDA